ncbi:MAG: diaminopimelate decarboxylase [Rhodospirillales bacterium]|nr:diaminopimelate decarboxylase [Alphaproteobacteria bacterium]USO03155.1 MAG: diaminopimelate decarboxylase [Rhodospirillales bacterium]
MNGFEEKDGLLCADDVPLNKIAAQAGTPTYVYSAAVIETQFNALKGAMEKALPAGRQPLICYACKANSNLALLDRLRALGSGMEIVSLGELQRGLRAGFNPQKIVSTGVGKQKSEIAAYLKAGIHQFNVESLPELEAINSVAAQMNLQTPAPVALRINPNVAAGGHHKISTGRKRDKFGIGIDRIDEIYAAAEAMPHVAPVGLHMHIGSQISQVEAFKTAFEKLPGVVQALRRKGHSVTRLDIGGGFPIVYKDETLLDLDAYASWVNDIIVPLDTEIIMEPGRYLVGNAGVLLTEVLYVKETDDRTFLIVDAAMNDLIRPTLYEAWHGIEPVANRQAAPKTYDVVGPVCETGDTFATARDLPEMKAGDLAVVKSAGAYGMSMASNYNTRGLPAEVMAKDGSFKIVRKRQSVEEIIDQDIVPAWD